VRESGQAPTYEKRVRVGDWRIVYRIEDGRLVVVVVRVAVRGGVYG
jgi:mRNA interferase RelE/StbE